MAVINYSGMFTASCCKV